MSQDNENCQDPQEDSKAPRHPIQYLQNAQYNGNFDQANADVTDDLTCETPLQGGQGPIQLHAQDVHTESSFCPKHDRYHASY